MYHPNEKAIRGSESSTENPIVCRNPGQTLLGTTHKIIKLRRELQEWARGKYYAALATATRASGPVQFPMTKSASDMLGRDVSLPVEDVLINMVGRAKMSASSSSSAELSTKSSSNNCSNAISDAVSEPDREGSV